MEKERRFSRRSIQEISDLRISPTNSMSRRLSMSAGVTFVFSEMMRRSARAALPAKGSANPTITYGNRPRPGRHDGSLSIGSLVYPHLDQIDFTGPFEVFSRLPNTTIQVVAKTTDPVRDVKGLIVTPTVAIARAQEFDVLHVAGGFGQQAMMNDNEVISLIRRQIDAGRLVFSVCTGALLCGAAGVLKGRLATTHWAALDLLKYYGAIPTKSRVVVDGNYVSCAGVTSGIDGALALASLLHGNTVAEEIQLEIQYEPDPIFHSGNPEEASDEVKDAFYRTYGENRHSREAEARRFARILGVNVASM